MNYIRSTIAGVRSIFRSRSRPATAPMPIMMSYPSSTIIPPHILSAADLKWAAHQLTSIFSFEGLPFAFMNTSAIMLLSIDNDMALHRPTAELHICITPPPGFDTYTLSTYLINQYPETFERVDLYGIPHLGIRIPREPVGNYMLAEIDIMDATRWTSRASSGRSDAHDPEGEVIQVNVDGDENTPVCSPAWVLRDKIMAQAQAERRQGPVYLDDQSDIEAVLSFVEDKQLRLRENDQTRALRVLRRDRPDLEPHLKRAIDCPVGLGEWIWDRRVRKYFRYALNGTIQWDMQ
jgi:hypothetical protein